MRGYCYVWKKREEVVARMTGAEMSADTANEQMQLYKVLKRYCSIVVSTLPILCIYPFVQKYFVNGVMIGSIKG